jgi:hypothetical protein
MQYSEAKSKAEKWSHLLQSCAQDGTVRAAQAGVSTHRQHTTVLQALPRDKVTAALPPEAVGGQAGHNNLYAWTQQKQQ